MRKPHDGELNDMPSESDPLDPEGVVNRSNDIIGASDIPTVGIFSLGVIGLALFGGYKLLQSIEGTMRSVRGR